MIEIVDETLLYQIVVAFRIYLFYCGVSVPLISFFVNVCLLCIRPAAAYVVLPY
jgi:hypothetical protein